VLVLCRVHAVPANDFARRSAQFSVLLRKRRRGGERSFVGDPRLRHTNTVPSIGRPTIRIPDRRTIFAMDAAMLVLTNDAVSLRSEA
jgi:hypothetical protein